MKQRMVRISAAAVAVSLALLPAAAFAEDGGSDDSAEVQVQTQGGPVGVPVSAGPQMQGSGEDFNGGVPGGPGPRMGEDRGGPGPRAWTGSTSPMSGEREHGPRMMGSTTSWGEGEHAFASSSEWMSERAQEVSEALAHMSDRAKQILGAHFNLDLESSTTIASSSEELKQLIEQRRQELEQEAASSSPEAQDIVENNDGVRVAVHALLASRDLLGGIGQQVSQIAQDVNASLATTTVAEAQIKSRGFLRKFLFGGDKGAGETLAQTASSTQEKISELTDLLNQASTTADVKAMLQAQIQAIESAQARIEQLAEQQNGNGLLGWLSR